MLSKVFSGHLFYHACQYVVNKPGAEVLECEGVRGHDYKLMSDDFIMQQQMRPEKEKACFHCSLSFYPGEVLKDELMVKIAKEYLERLGINNTQFTITKHTDRRHMHLHVVANMVDNNGKAISDSFLGLRGKKIAQQLTKEYSLVQALGKKLELTNHEALRTFEANKYKIYKATMEALPHCKTMQDLEKKLQLQGIGTQYKYRRQTLEKQGVSFKIGEDCFKGSKVDRQFSLSNLENTLAQSQKQFSQLKPKAARNDSHSLLPKRQTIGSVIGEHLGKEIEKSMEKMVEVLLKPEETFQQMPYELLQENKKKKKKLSGNQNVGHIINIKIVSYERSVISYNDRQKVDAHERKIEQLQEKIEQLPDYTETLNLIKSREDEILSVIKKIFFPEKEVRELSATMVTGLALMKQPVKQEIIHHHHIKKAIWITAPLFLIVCFLSTALYITADKLKLYKANDTKYRYLKLEANPSFNKWLGIIDSLSIVKPKMRDPVIAKEEQNQRNFEMMQQALQMEKEAKELKQKVRKKIE